MLDLQSQLAPSTAPAVRHRRAFDDLQNPGRKLAVASVQGLDQLRKLVLPDALLGIVGNAITGPISGRREVQPASAGGGGPRKEEEEEEEKARLRDRLDELVASVCVLCEGAIASVERPFVDEGEEM